MAVQFTLIWDALISSTNALTISAEYRQKSIGGAFITTGFTPANPLPKTALTAKTPSLLDNVIYQFKTITTCTMNGPTPNSNGIQEAINFAAILPTLSSDASSATITLDVTNTDITKAKFTLRKQSDNTIVGGTATISRVGNSITLTKVGLTTATNYYWQVNLYTTVAGIEVIGNTFGPYAVLTS